MERNEDKAVTVYLKVPPQHSCRMIKKTMKNFNQESQYPIQDWR
jgi:hypothetical protein